MYLGVFTVALADMSLKESLDYLQGLGVQAVELGTGGYSSPVHCSPDKLLKDKDTFDEFRKTIAASGMKISALSCHGNSIHPDKERAMDDHQVFMRTVQLAQKLEIDRIVTFSGCPGDCAESRYPNWVVCPWPEDYQKILQYQWEDVLIPYWEKAVKYAAECGVTKICLELHPGFMVYNPATLLRLRAAVGNNIYANLDPSHLFWQGINPALAIEELGEAVGYFHAKDTYVYPERVRVNGVLDSTGFDVRAKRSWLFRTLGYGHGEDKWKKIISALRTSGYDDVVSIEHEDCFMSRKEGLEKAIHFLNSILVREQPDGIWWG